MRAFMLVMVTLAVVVMCGLSEAHAADTGQPSPAATVPSAGPVVLLRTERVWYFPFRSVVVIREKVIDEPVAFIQMRRKARAYIPVRVGG